jgi:hypothetical protein
VLENGAEPIAESDGTVRPEPRPAVAAANGAEARTDDYVPMSEWLDDLDE